MPTIQSNVFSVTISATSAFSFGTIADISVLEMLSTAHTAEYPYPNLGAPEVDLSTVTIDFFSDAGATTSLADDSNIGDSANGGEEEVQNVVTVSNSDANTLVITVTTSGVGLADNAADIVVYCRLQVEQDDP